MLLGTMKEENFAINKSVCTQRKILLALCQSRKYLIMCVRFVDVCAVRPAEQLLVFQLLSKVNFPGLLPAPVANGALILSIRRFTL